MTSNEIDISIVGKAGRITLHRPEALNALTYDMCLKIDAALEEWRENDQVQVVIIDSEGSRAFCAGGDIAALYEAGSQGDYEAGRKFWQDEYALNVKIRHYPKPYIALMDGIVMGGGAGLAIHGSHRIVTENTMFAMPECGIGLIPDVGSNYLLAEAAGSLGEYIAATGARLGAADCIFAGLADCFVPEAQLPSLIRELEESGDTSKIDAYVDACSDSELEKQLSDINDHFSKPDALSIAQSLESDASVWTQLAAKLMRKGNPLSVGCAIEVVRKARELESIEVVLKLEYRFTYRSMSQGDLIEGIRAQIIDKDKNPNWQVFSLEELERSQIENMLKDLGEAELVI